MTIKALCSFDKGLWRRQGQRTRMHMHTQDPTHVQVSSCMLRFAFVLPWLQRHHNQIQKYKLVIVVADNCADMLDRAVKSCRETMLSMHVRRFMKQEMTYGL